MKRETKLALKIGGWLVAATLVLAILFLAFLYLAITQFDAPPPDYESGGPIALERVSV